MSRTYHHHYGPKYLHQVVTRPGKSIKRYVCSARKARRQLLKLFPHLVPRLHKGVSALSIYQHAVTLAQAPPGPPVSVTNK